MAIFQGVLIYNNGEAGWSTVYYLDAADHAGAKTKLDAINTAAVALMTTNTDVIGGRVSNVEVKGDGLLFTPASDAGLRDLTGQKEADLNLACRFQFLTADYRHRVNHFVHNLEVQDLTVGAGRDKIDAASIFLGSAGTAYITAVLSNSVCWAGRVIPAVGTPLTIGNVSPLVSVRRVGRPFGQYHGRR